MGFKFDLVVMLWTVEKNEFVLVITLRIFVGILNLTCLFGELLLFCRLQLEWDSEMPWLWSYNPLLIYPHFCEWSVSPALVLVTTRLEYTLGKHVWSAPAALLWAVGNGEQVWTSSVDRPRVNSFFLLHRRCFRYCKMYCTKNIISKLLL